jgi:hypothetical protein
VAVAVLELIGLKTRLIVVLAVATTNAGRIPEGREKGDIVVNA